mmetsp:Transcript_57942/g.183904  ORF Transcript_57942/g.183904 Transcript_57942/m.183904 type:complete len:454 (-) Transcript_57942:1734-3095(-)
MRRMGGSALSTGDLTAPRSSPTSRRGTSTPGVRYSPLLLPHPAVLSPTPAEQVAAAGIGGPRMGRKGVVGLPGLVEGRLGASKAISVAASGHSVAVAADGSMYTWGRNASSGGGGGGSPPMQNAGQLGIRRAPPGHPEAVEGPLMHKRVAHAAAGRYHTVAVTHNGLVYAFGLNDFGQLGRWDASHSGVPHLVEGLPSGDRVVAATCGRYHTVVATAGGEVYTWGLNYWQLPEAMMGNSNRLRIPMLEGEMLRSAATPRRVLGGLEGKRVVAVDAGYVHWLAVTADGEVHAAATGFTGYAMVENKPGEVLGRAGDPLVPQRVGGMLLGRKIVAAAAGRCHSFAVDDTGILFSWGCQGGGGQLGRAGDKRTPGQVEGEVEGMKIVGAAAGEYFSMAWCADGHLYAWGSNGNDQLGVEPGNTKGKFPLPRKVQGLKGKVLAVGAGYQHVVALVSQ